MLHDFFEYCPAMLTHGRDMDLYRRKYANFARGELMSIIYSNKCIINNCDNPRMHDDDKQGTEYFVCADHMYTPGEIRTNKHPLLCDKKWSPLNFTWSLQFPSVFQSLDIQLRLRNPVRYHWNEMEQLDRNRALVEDIIRCGHRYEMTMDTNPMFSPAHGIVAASVVIGLPLLIRRALRYARA